MAEGDRYGVQLVEPCGTCGRPVEFLEHEGERVPSCVEFTAEGDGFTAQLHATYRPGEGHSLDRFEVAGANLAPDVLELFARYSDRFITAEVAKAMIPRGVRITDAAGAVEAHGAGRTREDYADHLETRRRRRHAVTHERLTEVAAAYLSNPRTPLKQVEADCHLSPAQASRLIGKARDAGLIPPKESR